MRIIFSILKWLFIGIGLIILAALILPQVGVLINKSGKDNRAEFLLANAAYSGPIAGLDAMQFPEDFYQNRLFLFGEIHGYSNAQDVDIALVKHLNNKIGLRWYIAELDPAQAMIINHYLDGGDDTLVRKMFDTWHSEGAQWGNKDFYAKLTQLRALNQTLSEDGRIHLFGVDYIQQPDLVDMAITLPAPPPSNQKAVAARRINEELLTGTRARDNKNRYLSILPNIDLILNDAAIGDDPLYGFWGIFHVLKTKVNETSVPLAVHLEKKPALTGKIVTLIAQNGPGSSMMMPSSIMPPPLQSKNGETYVKTPGGNDNPYIGYMDGIYDLNTAANGADVSIFNLDAEGTPYADSKKFVSWSGALMMAFPPFRPNGSTTEVLDYIVYFENNPALTPWKGTAHDVTGGRLSAE